MATCGNCGKRLSCSCQKRTSKDGIQGCSSCITAPKTSTTTSGSISVTGKAPTQFNVNGGSRYSNLNNYVPVKK